MIDSVLNYFKSIVNEQGKDLVFDGFIFGTEKVPNTQIERTYQMTIGALVPNRQDKHIIATLPVTIVLWKKTNQHRQVEDFLEIYCLANGIHVDAMDQSKVDQTDFIKNINTRQVAPTPLASSDNCIRLEIEFEVTLIYTGK